MNIHTKINLRSYAPKWMPKTIYPYICRYVDIPLLKLRRYGLNPNTKAYYVPLIKKPN